MIQTDPNFKGAYPQTLLRTLYDNQLGSEVSRLSFCKEAFTSIPIVIYTRRDFFLRNAMNTKIEMVKAAGLVEFWHFKDIDKRMLNFKPVNYPKVLTMSQLKGCFYILLFGYLISGNIFLLELFLTKLFPK